MCGPAAIPIAALAASVVSTAGMVYSGMAANAQGKYAAAVSRQNARLAHESARDALERGQLERRSLFRRISQTKGQQAAAMAANGIDLGFGSALDVQRDTAMMGAEDAAALSKNIESQMKGFEIEAVNHDAEARAQRMRGKAALVGSFFSAGSSILEGVSQFKKLQTQFG